MLVIFYVESETPAGLKAMFTLLEAMSMDSGEIPDTLMLQVPAACARGPWKVPLTMRPSTLHTSSSAMERMEAP